MTLPHSKLAHHDIVVSAEAGTWRGLSVGSPMPNRELEVPARMKGQNFEEERNVSQAAVGPHAQLERRRIRDPIALRRKLLRF